MKTKNKKKNRKKYLQQNRELILDVRHAHFVVYGRPGPVALAQSPAAVDHGDDDVLVAAQVRGPVHRPFFRHRLSAGLALSGSAKERNTKLTSNKPYSDRVMTRTA